MTWTSDQPSWLGVPASLLHHLARSGCAGSNWLYPLVDGQPPIGWDDASRYLVLPVLLVLFQYVSSAAIAPPPDPNQVSRGAHQEQFTTISC